MLKAQLPFEDGRQRFPKGFTATPELKGKPLHFSFAVQALF